MWWQLAIWFAGSEEEAEADAASHEEDAEQAKGAWACAATAVEAAGLLCASELFHLNAMMHEIYFVLVLAHVKLFTFLVWCLQEAQGHMQVATAKAPAPKAKAAAVQLVPAAQPAATTQVVWWCGKKDLWWHHEVSTYRGSI